MQDREIIWGKVETVPTQLSIPKLYCDGSLKPNRPASYGFVVVTSTDTKTHKAYSGIVPAHIKQTNNVAEYMSVIQGLKHIHDNIGTSVEVYMDSQLVVNQVNGLWRVKDSTLHELYLQAKEVIKEFSSFDIQWIPRNDNIADRYSR